MKYLGAKASSYGYELQVLMAADESVLGEKVGKAWNEGKIFMK